MAIIAGHVFSGTPERRQRCDVLPADFNARPNYCRVAAAYSALGVDVKRLWEVERQDDGVIVKSFC